MVLISTTSRYTGDEFCDVSLENVSDNIINGHVEAHTKNVNKGDGCKVKGASRIRIGSERDPEEFAYHLTSNNGLQKRDQSCQGSCFRGQDINGQHTRSKPSEKTQMHHLPTFDTHAGSANSSSDFDLDVVLKGEKDYSNIEPGRCMCYGETSVNSYNVKDDQFMSSSSPGFSPLTFHSTSTLTDDTVCEDSDAATLTNGIIQRSAIKNRCRKPSLVDGLLISIYRQNRRRSSVGHDSDTLTEHSTTSDTPYYYTRGVNQRPTYSTQSRSGAVHRRSRLLAKNREELRQLVISLQAALSTKCSILIKELKKKDRLRMRRDQQNDVVTAILHALSQKR
ncbi:hypothetical protein SK128_007346, partial [Halocaridina rubra]